MTKNVITGNFDQWAKQDPALGTNGLRFSMWLTRVARLQDVRFSAICKSEFKLLTSEARLLLALRRSGRPFALRPTDLFRAQLITSGGMTKQIDRLCDMGLVLRNRDPLHAGGYLVQLTAVGLKTSDRLIKHIARPGDPSDLIGKELDRLGAKNAEVVEQFMDRVLAILEAAAAETDAERNSSPS